MVGRDGIEPPTPGFSVLAVIRPPRPSSQRFALSRVRRRRRAKLRSVARWRAAWVTVSVTAGRPWRKRRATPGHWPSITSRWLVARAGNAECYTAPETYWIDLE